MADTSFFVPAFKIHVHDEHLVRLNQSLANENVAIQTKMIFRVTDVNDNAPQFGSSSYKVRIKNQQDRCYAPIW